ncbi:hypothetical protein HYDPIDRAFT_31118 [Hydnomerulius pinastri MD-312]|uniref:Uncharacterized protein n=1 Tax=Hydnomerulius pinastri MD-312 TaxID=994086 RepID=A0A0C9VUR3_9AGAM|nr:hypothetical protein HYDPIDRAFT_31118 [Hydnomerulius pinastri MD-312]
MSAYLRTRLPRNIHPSTPMDNEASSRGTTVYLVDKRIACFLRFWGRISEPTEDTDIVSVRSTKSVVASKAVFEHEEAQMRQDDPCVVLPSSVGMIAVAT